MPVNFINQLMGGIRSQNTPTGNPAASLMVGQKGLNSGLDALAQVGKEVVQKRIDSDVATALASMGDTSQMSPTQYQDALFQTLGKVPGVNATEALGLAAELSKPRFDARDYRDDRIDANNLNAYRSAMSGRGSYGMTVDDYGNAYMLNKHTGEYEQVSTGNAGRVNPKNIVLKSITSKDANGVETTTQVPFDKTTGQPVSQQPDVLTTVPEAKLVDFMKTEYGITTADEFNALPPEKQQAIRQEAIQAFTPVASISAQAGNAVGVKMPTLDKATKEAKDSLESSMNLINNINVPTESQSGPFDSRVDDMWAWLNLDTKDSVAAKDFDAEVANLTTAFGTAQVKGVLSDKDTKFITDQMPSRKYSPEVNTNRINSIKKKLREAVMRFNESNPYHPIHLGDTNTSLVNQQQKGSKYGTDAEIISF